MDVRLLQCLEKQIRRDALYTVIEAAALAGVHRDTIYRWHGGAKVSGLGVIYLPFCGADDRRRALIQGDDLLRFLFKMYSRREPGERPEMLMRCPHCGKVVVSA